MLRNLDDFVGERWVMQADIQCILSTRISSIKPVDDTGLRVRTGLASKRLQKIDVIEAMLDSGLMI